MGLSSGAGELGTPWGFLKTCFKTQGLPVSSDQGGVVQLLMGGSEWGWATRAPACPCSRQCHTEELLAPLMASAKPQVKQAPATQAFGIKGVENLPDPDMTTVSDLPTQCSCGKTGPISWLREVPKEPFSGLGAAHGNSPHVGDLHHHSNVAHGWSARKDFGPSAILFSDFNTWKDPSLGLGSTWKNQRDDFWERTGSITNR